MGHEDGSSHVPSSVEWERRLVCKQTIIILDDKDGDKKSVSESEGAQRRSK